MSRRVLFAGVAALVVLGHAAPASAQVNDETPGGRIGWTLELGVTAATPFVEDGNGVTSRAGVGPIVAGGLSVKLSERAALATGIRVATSSLRVESHDEAWRAGRVSEYAASLGVEVRAIPSVAISASLLGARLTGPSDVIPFRAGALTTWGTDVGGYVRTWRRVPLDLVVGASFFHLPAQPGETLALDRGWTCQLRLGGRHVIR